MAWKLIGSMVLLAMVAVGSYQSGRFSREAEIRALRVQNDTRKERADRLDRLNQVLMQPCEKHARAASGMLESK
ncbi:hypothetical protein [Lysobacter sp. 1R34A]|uniref:hypothetical protein n=1 Tax=Lysobacter sp. 1R34A TaxID=3445786 RepID=UPI003EEB5372